MPLYEYRCKRCKKEFEVLQKINSAPLDHCIYCPGKVEKLVSRSSFQLKGSGWYLTDYKNAAKKDESAPRPAGKEESGEKKSTDKNANAQTK